jgi:hypothetical protein
MGCEESFTTMKLHWHSYLVFSLDSCAHEACTETGIRSNRIYVKNKWVVYFTAIVCLATRATATPLVARHASCGEQKTENNRSKGGHRKKLNQTVAFVGGNDRSNGSHRKKLNQTVAFVCGSPNLKQARCGCEANNPKLINEANLYVTNKHAY